LALEEHQLITQALVAMVTTLFWHQLLPLVAVVVLVTLLLVALVVQVAAV
jgi:hypothetical protein